MSERTLTVAEAAQALSTTEKAVRRRIERGVLPSVKDRDGKRRIPASALGLDAPAGNGGAPAPRAAPSNGHASTPDLLDRLERLSREVGSLRQIEAVAGQNEQMLIEARARIAELEALLERPRRWWRR